ncbi:Phosphoesterase PA-phosphatase related protein (modular protein) [Candidatus Zixiibacteriota bacterium]|nr:Phosphoesterase PA-phosphatase related protein (modular protein) [candidate division Zixibacteria bacterium]
MRLLSFIKISIGLILWLLLAGAGGNSFAAISPQIDSSNAPGTVSADSCRTEFIFSSAYAGTLWNDGKYILRSPLRWRKTDWIKFSAGLAAVSGSMFLLDRPVRDFMRRNRNHTTDDIGKFYEPFGRQYPFGLSGAFYVIGLIAKNKNAQRTGLDGFAASLIASEIITPALKITLGRSRPWQNRGLYHYHPFSGDDSFPSGHTTRAFMLATVISEHYPRTWVKILAYSTATMVACSRMNYDMHFFSDVTAGALIGTFVARAVVRLNEQRRCQKQD